jgi:photosystem II stability/assembly factor-like uncharacterized protein
MLYPFIIAALLCHKPVHPPSLKPLPVMDTAADIFYHSPDQGWRWNTENAGLPPTIQVQYVTVQGDYLFLGSENYGIYRKSKYAHIWQPVGDLNFAANDKITGLYATPEAVFACVYKAGFYKSTDGGKTWKSMHQKLADKSVRAVFQKKDALLVGADSGVFYSADNGKTWKKTFGEGQVTTLTEVNGWLFGGTYKGVIRSKDGGKHWKWVLQEGAVLKTTVLDSSIVALNMSGEVMISPDGGDSWDYMNSGPADNPVFDMVQAGPYYLCSYAHGIYRSADRGAHWEQMLDTQNAHFLDLTVENGVVYGATVRRK